MTVIYSPFPSWIMDIKAWFLYDSHDPNYHLSHRQIEHFYSEKLNLTADELRERISWN